MWRLIVQHEGIPLRNFAVRFADFEERTMKLRFKSLVTVIMVGAMPLTPAHAQSAAGWKALHYATQNVWSCNIVQPYPGFDDGFIRPTLELRFDHKGEEPNLSGSYTEEFKQYGPNGSVASANYNFGAHVFESPEEGTGIYLESATLALVEHHLDRPFAWLPKQSWIRFRILAGDNGDSYRITGDDADGASYTCSTQRSTATNNLANSSPVAANHQAAIDGVDEKRSDLQYIIDRIGREFEAASDYVKNGPQDGACEQGHLIQADLDRANADILYISDKMTNSAYSDAERSAWATERDALRGEFHTAYEGAMLMLTKFC